MAIRPPHTQNRILAALSEDNLGKLLPHLTTLEMRRQDVLSVENDPVHYIYFPHHGLISLMMSMKDGTTADATSVGPEGLLGLGAVLGRGRYYTRNVVQISGASSRIGSRQFLELLSQCPSLQRIINLYLGAFIAQALRNVVCNALHVIEDRTARWLLLAQDAVLTDTFDLPQGFLAEMLGVRRASVNLATRSFQTAGLISHNGRGEITILNRKGLEQASCECYEETRKILAEIFDS